jgi:hypothetical protein
MVRQKHPRGKQEAVFLAAFMDYPRQAGKI